MMLMLFLLACLLMIEWIVAMRSSLYRIIMVRIESNKKDRDWKYQ